MRRAVVTRDPLKIGCMNAMKTKILADETFSFSLNEKERKWKTIFVLNL
jgi:hypothetical protein